MPPPISLFCVSIICGERQPFLTQTEITSLMLEMFYPKGGFTRESYLNQKFHWVVLNYSKGDLCQGFLRGIGSTSWGGFGSHQCGHPWPHSDVQSVLGPSTGVGAAPGLDHPPLLRLTSHSQLDVASGRVMKSVSADFTHGCNRLKDWPGSLTLCTFNHPELLDFLGMA